MSTAVARRVEARTEEGRERRDKVRQELAKSLPGRSLIELSVDAPQGSPLDAKTEELFLSGLQRLEEELGVAPAAMLGDAAGAYGLFVTQMPALLARSRASRIEGQASWERRLVLECYGIAGSHGATGRVPRAVVGAPSRR